MLQFIAGSAGAGKSTAIYQKIIAESLQNPQTNYLVIVPEQFTLQTQKELVLLHPNKGIMNIDVLSFVRLAFRVFEEVGTKQGLVLEDMGKSLIVKKVLMEQKDKLVQFSGNVNRQGFTDEMKSVLSEFFQYSVEEETLERMKQAAKGRPALERKLRDIETIYHGFRAFLQEKYITAEEIFDLLGRELAKSRMMQEAVVVLDGFTGFTPSQYHLLEALLKHAKKVYVTITIDRRESTRLQKEHQLFFLSRKTMDRLAGLAANVHCEIEEPVLLPEKEGQCPYRFEQAPALAALERNLFRYPHEIYEQPTEEIRLCLAPTPEAEVRFTACEIKRLIHKGLRYRDIAVVAGDIETYGELLQREFDRAQIPGFVDYKRDILSDPLVELLRSLLELAEGNFSYEQVFRWCKCGLSELKREECDRLETYVRALGIRGKSMWTKPWKRVVKSAYPENLEELNQLRERVMAVLLPVVEQLAQKAATTAMRIQALREYLLEHQIEARMEAFAAKLQEATDTGLSTQRENALLVKEYEQVYRMIEDIFTRAEELLGEEVLPITEFREIMETGFQEAKVGLVPPGSDQVVVGDIERTRLRGIKRLFFLGVNDGIVPGTKESGGILSDVDRSFLVEQGIELSPTRRQSAYTAEFYLYLNLTKPQEALYLCYAAKDRSGKKLAPSYLIGRICELFPKVVTERTDRQDEAEFLLGTDNGRTALIRSLREYREKRDSDTALLEELLLLPAPGTVPVAALAEHCFYQSPLQKLSEQSARKLYGQVVPGSVTRLEQYASCALAHFLNYGLHLEERKEFKLSMPDLGTIFHKALELYAEKLKEQKLSWRSVEEQKRKQLAAEATLEAARDYGNGILQSTKRNEFIVNRVERILNRTVATVQEQLHWGKFEPERFEQLFTYSNRYLALRGRIDRIDTYEEDGTIYVKVTDYKTGSTAFDLNRLYYGLQMQLGVYLGASIDLIREEHPGSEVVPAGILYYRLNDPIVDKSEHAEADIKKALRPNGLVNSEPKVLAMLDRKLEKQPPSVVSDCIPAETKADGSLSSRSAVASSERLIGITEYLDGLMQRFGTEILAGEAECNPYRIGKAEPCGYCNYRQICSFGELSGKHCRKLEKLPSEDIWAEIGQKNKNR